MMLTYCANFKMRQANVGRNISLLLFLPLLVSLSIGCPKSHHPLGSCIIPMLSAYDSSLAVSSSGMNSSKDVCAGE